MKCSRVRAALATVVAVVGLSACGIANPWPGSAPVAPDHHTVLVIGDSLSGQADVTLSNLFTTQGFDTTIIDAHQNGSGLIGPFVATAPDGTVTTYPAALDYVKTMLDQYPDADTVLFEWAGACTVCITTGPAFGSDAFYQQWIAQAQAIIDEVHVRGLTVVWAISPPLGIDSNSAASGAAVRVATASWLSMFDTAILEPYAATGAVTRVDWHQALTDTAGNYQTTLWYDGGTHTVRFDDLVHLTMDGSTRASTWTVAGLGALWASQPPTAAALTAPRAPGLVQAGAPVTIAVGGAQP